MKLVIKKSPPKIRIRRVATPSWYWSVHTHSKFSAKDAMPTVAEIVAAAKRLNQPAVALTDHGNMAGTVQLYLECMKAGIKPFPGTELYLVHSRQDKKAKRYHAGVVAFTSEGYKNLVKLNSRMHQQFHFKPLLDLADLAEMGEAGELKGIAFTTGCYFGMVIQTLVEHGYDAAKALVASFAQWFDQTYVEIQSHHIDQEPMSELEISVNLIQIAQDLDLKVIVTQDSHYTDPEHKKLHESMKRLVAFGPDTDDAVFPGDGFHMVDEKWMEEHHKGYVIQAAKEGLADLLSRHTLTIPQLDHYDYNVPFTVANPDKYLRRYCYDALEGMGILTDRHMKRLESELQIVEHARMSGYLLLVKEVTDHCREVEIFFQARGSAAGSLICFILGITSVDPLKWGLLMERFLSKDRTKPPDVDLDIESTRRGELLEWLSSRFTAMQIGTWGKLSMGGDNEDEDNEGGGSLLVKFFSAERKKGREPAWKDVPQDVRDELYALSEMELYNNHGVHAAGVLLTTTKQEMEELVPSMYVASSKTTVSQYDMKDVEKLGLVKLDVLGLKTMSVLRQTILNMGRDPKEGMDFIPLNDRETYKMIASGDTAGVFQLEGGTAARGVRSLKPNKIQDVIAAMALYRPATMQSGATDSFVKRKHKEEAIPERHEIIQRHTKETYGILLYQEQVIAVLRDLGLDPDELTAFLKAVKASNGDIGNAAGVIKEMLVDIKERCRAKGMTEADISWLEEALEAYAGYGFNSAHATIYGITAYRCAYLAKNFPVQFHAALLAVAAGSDKEPKYISACRGRGVRVLRADINSSPASYGVDPNGKGVRRGLLAVKNVGIKAATEIAANSPFKNLDDFRERVNPRIVTGIKDMPKTLEELEKASAEDELKGVIKALANAGAFETMED